MSNSTYPLLITQYSKNKVVLSDKSTIEGSFVLSSDNKISLINHKIDSSDLFSNINLVADYILPHLYNKELLLVGCGDKFIIPSFELKKYLHSINLKLEWTTTPSAIHTYNLLMEDLRSCIGIFYQ